MKRRTLWLLGIVVCVLAAQCSPGDDVTAEKAIDGELLAELTGAVREAVEGGDGAPAPRALVFLMERYLETSDEGLARLVKAKLSEADDTRRSGDKKEAPQRDAGRLRLYCAAYRLYGEEPYRELAMERARSLRESLGQSESHKAAAAAAFLETGASLNDSEWSLAGRSLMEELISEKAETRIDTIADHVRMLEALLAGYEHSGDLRLRRWAEELFREARERFRSQDGSYPEDGAPGRSAFHASGAMAQTAMRLHYMTGEDDYRDDAEKVLVAFREISGREAADAGAYGLAAGYYLVYPYKAIVIGKEEERRKLLAGVLTLPLVNRVVLPVDPAKDPEELERLGYPDLGKPTVFLCTDRSCSMPVFEAERLRGVLEHMRKLR